jgi:hypothetical protein
MSITSEVRREIERIVDERVERAWASRDDLTQIKAVLRETVEIQKQTGAAVRELAQRQERTEETLQGMQAAVRELAGQQQRTEAAVRELAEQQTRTEATVERLARGIADVRQEVGGISNTLGYSLENEAYRSLPGLLRERYRIDIQERFTRRLIRGEEVNFLARARKEGNEVILVGESKLRLGDRSYQPDQAQAVFGQLDRKVAAVQEEHPGLQVVKLLVTHFAAPRFLQEAQERGVLVVQSHEW